MTPSVATTFGRHLARRGGGIGLAFALVATAIVAAPAPRSAATAPLAIEPSRPAVAAPTGLSATPSLAPTPSRTTATSTIAPGFDAIGRSLAAMAAGDTPAPAATSVAATPCPFCTDVPIPDLGATPSPAAAAAFRLRVPIFEYHRVKPYQGEHGFSKNLITPPRVFDAQMDAMAAAGWKTITMAELGDDLRFGIKPDPKTFVITFDDGYEDNYQNAFPILEAHGFTATFYVIAGRIGQDKFMTPFEIARLARNGFDIGNHSYSHRDLGRLSPTELAREFRGASAIIANITGAWPKSFAYPMGFGSSLMTSYLNACPGLSTAVVQSGRQPETWANRWKLARIRVGPATYPSELVDLARRY